MRGLTDLERELGDYIFRGGPPRRKGRLVEGGRSSSPERCWHAVASREPEHRKSGGWWGQRPTRSPSTHLPERAESDGDASASQKCGMTRLYGEVRNLDDLSRRPIWEGAQG